MKINHKILVILIAVFGLSMFLKIPSVLSREISNNELMEEIRKLKAKTKLLEDQIKGEVSAEGKGEEEGHYHSVKGLADRMRRIENKMKEGLLGNWSDRISLSGLIEIEAAYEDMDFKDSAESDEDSSDIALATVELGIDVDIVKHVKGHVLFLWEEDDTEPVDLDEGFIIIDGEDRVPLYLNAGKMYVPFGQFESHFISDPLTLELGETRESAVTIGFANDMFNLCFSAFNGDIDEIGDDDHINTYAGSLTFSRREDGESACGLMVGVSYISNIADSDSLQDEDGADGAGIKDYVGGFGAFLSVSLMDKIFMEVEYLGATDSFEPGELAFDEGSSYEPKTWNFELACAATEALEVAFKYEGSDDCGTFLPEKQYGAAAVYSLFENTSLAFEYLHGEFENDDERDLFTCQIAVEF